MIDIALLREKPDEVAKNFLRRGFELDIEAFQSLDGELRELRKEEEQLRTERNKLTKEVGALFQQGEQEKAQKLQNRSANVGDEINKLHATVAQVQSQLNDFLLKLPNILDSNVPDGTSEEDNEVLRQVGKPPAFDFEPLDHVGLGDIHKLLDLKLQVRWHSQGLMCCVVILLDCIEYFHNLCLIYM